MVCLKNLPFLQGQVFFRPISLNFSKDLWYGLGEKNSEILLSPFKNSHLLHGIRQFRTVKCVLCKKQSSTGIGIANLYRFDRAFLKTGFRFDLTYKIRQG